MGATKYANVFKKEICRLICEEGKPTQKTAEAMEIPLKTVEKWITSYHKNPRCFDRPDDYDIMVRREFARRYDKLDSGMLVSELKKRDLEISFLRSVIKVKDLKLKNARDKNIPEM